MDSLSIRLRKITMQITIDITGQKEVAEVFKRLGDRASNLSPAWPDFRGHMRAAIAMTFRAGGRPEKWPVSKRVQEHGGQTLRDKGILQNSFTFAFDASSFTMGTADPRAIAHQTGMTIVPKAAKSLAIPINAPEGIRPRDFLASLGEKNFFVKKGKGGDGGIIFQKLPGGGLSPLYALRKSVILPKREILHMLPEDWVYLGKCLIRHIIGEK
jgi:phage gpG-like protein